MKRVRHISNSVKGKTLLCTFVIALIMSLVVPSTALSQDGKADRQKIVHQVVDKWIQIGLEQYDRGFYQAAERSFLRAKSFEDHLDAAKRNRLEQLLTKARNAATAQVETESPEVQQERAKIASIYNKSVDLYNSGNLEEARQGFLEVSSSGLMVAPAGERAEDYLAMIDDQLMAEALQGDTSDIASIEDTVLAAPEGSSVGIGISSEPQTNAVSVQPEYVAPAPVAEETQGGYIDVIKQRQAIIKSHANAVVQDALAKANTHIQQNEYEQAIKALDYAQSVVNKNRLQLGDDLYKQYSEQLQRQREMVQDAQTAHKQQLARIQQEKAIEEQMEVRSKMQQARTKRIVELMDNARAFQKQQRYEEALGQLNSLLALDPLNNEALILKDTLTDTIAFRKQIEVMKEREKERAKLFLETSKSEIPYASELVYPKNWLEISARRKPEDAIGQDTETKAVYEQLEQFVDLSNFNRDMPLSEAIGILQYSVTPALKIFVNWRDLYDNADIEKTTPIDMDPISSIKLGDALKLLLEAVSGGFAELGYGIENGIITIATQESIPSDLVTLVYDVSDLIGRPADYRIREQSGGGGGGGGVSDVGGGFSDSGQSDDIDSDELRERQATRINQLILLVQDTVFPDSWFEVGGEGTITSYGSKLLSIRASVEVHNEISLLLKELRKAQGYQIAIEAKFLKVRENFLEDIGLDVDITINPGGKFHQIDLEQESSLISAPVTTGVDGSLAGIGTVDRVVAGALTGGYGTLLDDLQVSFLLQATQAKEDSVLITAPKATVLSGESATFRSQKYLYYAGDIDIESREGTGETGRTSFNINYDERTVQSGTTLNITPTISADKKHVLLNIEVQLNDFLGFRRQVIDIPVFGDVAGGGGNLSIEFPETEVAQVKTRVSVPDGATLLLGGQKLGAEVESESGIPILSKIPVLGRAFGNRSKIKDHKILLIMVKPTIILNEEAEADAVANLKNSI